MRTSLLLVDHNRLHRQGLRALFEADREFEVIGEAQDSREAILHMARASRMLRRCRGVTYLTDPTEIRVRDPREAL